jgi:hypothetical protein
MQRIRFLSLVAAILFVLAGATDAHAGQYTLSYDFGADLSEKNDQVDRDTEVQPHGSCREGKPYQDRELVCDNDGE